MKGGGRWNIMVRASRSARWMTLLVVVALLAAACSSDDDPNEAGPTTTSPDIAEGTGQLAMASTVGLASGTGGSALQVRLSQGQALTDAKATPLQVVAGEPLSGSETQALLERVPALDDDTEDVEEFSRPTESLNPPRAGTTINVPFGGSDDPAPNVDTGSLEVLRYQPEGVVLVAPSVSITFNQPMVPIGTLGQLEVSDSPAQISPDVDGTWQWIGTRTLRFEANPARYDRLPMATSYTVTVPSGTRSASGKRLADDVSWTFRTPATAVKSLFPESHQDLSLTPVFAATFNQTIDEADILDVTTLTADGESVPLRLATTTEIEDAQVGHVIGSAIEGRWIAFRPVAELPQDAAITVEIGPAIPSAEGSVVGTHSTVVSNRTFGPLKVTETRCNSNRCAPLEPLNILFSNWLDVDEFSPDLITIDPPIPGAVVSIRRNTITISGATKGQTSYDVTISTDVPDRMYPYRRA